MLHPAWQRRAYPVTFFTTAPLEVLQAAIAGAEAERAAALAAEGGTGRPVPEAAIVPAAAAAGVMEAKVAAAQAAQAAAVQAAQAAVEGLQLGDAEQACALPRGRAKSDADLLEIESEEAADGDLIILGGETLSWLQGNPNPNPNPNPDPNPDPNPNPNPNPNRRAAASTAHERAGALRPAEYPPARRAARRGARGRRGALPRLWLGPARSTRAALRRG